MAVEEILAKGITVPFYFLILPSLSCMSVSDVKDILADGIGFISIGKGEGKRRADLAAAQVLERKLMSFCWKDVRSGLIFVAGGDDLTIGDEIEVAEIIKREVHPDALIGMGATVFPDFSKGMIEAVGIFMVPSNALKL
jgi:cell division GTPase FtsZ